MTGEVPPPAAGALSWHRFAAQLFDGIAAGYGLWARALTYGQYRRWQRALVEVMAVSPGALVLDLATGTGMVGRAMARRYGCRVVGLDLSARMLGAARRLNGESPPGERLDLVRGSALHLPFPDGQLDAVTFTFLLRYLPDPQQAFWEVARVVRPGGKAGSLEFFVPPCRPYRWVWRLHTRLVLPAAAVLLGRGWGRAGAFLGPSIEEFSRRFPLSSLEQMWTQAGWVHVQHRTYSWGSALVTWGYRG